MYLVPASGYNECDSDLPCTGRGRIIMAPSTGVTADGFTTARSRHMRRIVRALQLHVKNCRVRRGATDSQVSSSSGCTGCSKNLWKQAGNSW